MRISTKSLISLALGIAVGIFVGELAAGLQIVGDVFIQLLQMTVLPYVVISLILGLGQLTYDEAVQLARRAGAVLLLLWSTSLVLVLLMPLVFPESNAGAFFSTALVQPVPEFDLLGLYIPSNPFYALANSVVPAVVLFSVAIGVALIGVREKEGLLYSLKTLSKAISRITHFVIELTPVGVFSIAASAAGTIGLEELMRLQIFLTSYIGFSLLMAFWLLPGLISALTPLRYGHVIKLSRDAFVTAFATSSLIVVLPILAERSKELVAQLAPDDPDAAAAVDVIVPVSFSFPSSGKLLTLSFVPFAAWYSGAPLDPSQLIILISSGTASFFGSLHAAVPFLLDLLRIPSDMYEIFVATSVVNARFGTLLGAAHIFAVALLGACAVNGLLEVRARALLQYLAVSALLVTLLLAGMKIGFARMLTESESRVPVLESMHPILTQGRSAIIQDTASAFKEDRTIPVLDRIQSRGSLRVGYHERLPMAFANAAGEIVGLDIELAHLLATELDVDLELFAVSQDEIPTLLSTGSIDIAMPGIAVTTEALQSARLSRPYLNLTLAFAVRDHRRKDFASREAVQSLDSPRVGMIDLPYYRDMLARYLPNAEIIRLVDPRSFFEGADVEYDLDAMLYAAEETSAWSLLNPEFTVAIPHPDVVKVSVAFPVALGEEAMVRLLNVWFDLKKNDGTLQTLYDYWVLGKNAAAKKPRWSVIRDVLHWVE